ncbi:tyrosine-protein phosphatase [Agromyces sp. NPDC056965]|uniref:tyrosine-protein phosphatase n=1 Tax=Agromyces sp. NPDC056965 TaxID=3345983 RepID=UPI0036348DF5
MMVIEIAGVVGFRDVGGMAASQGRIREGVLFRSGHLAAADDRGADEVRARVRRIVDLRSDDEVDQAATAVAGIPITRLPLYLGSPRSFFLEDYSLDEIYAHLLADSSAELVAAVRVIAQGDPTLVHCTAGKDRTGLTIAIALSAVGADRDAVVADYSLTADLIPAADRRATSERLARTYPRSRHAAMLATESPAAVMRDTLALVDRTWGGAAGYLSAHGFSADDAAALHAALLTPSPVSASDPASAHSPGAST